MHRRLHLVRHGVTKWNQVRRFQGHTDVPLSDEGQQQAMLTADRMASMPITVCFSSDLSRAYETARPIADQLGIELLASFDLREANKGSLEGKYRDPDTGMLGDESHYHDENDLDARPPGGESIVDLGERSERFFQHLTSIESGLPPGEILLVSHGGTMRTMLAILLGFPISAGVSFHFDNCGITTVDFRGDLPPLLMRYNDVYHLD